MLTRRTFALAGLAWTAAGCAPDPASRATQAGTASANATLASLAVKEGALRVDAATNLDLIKDLLQSFGQLHPGIAFEYHNPSSSELQATFLDEIGAGRPTADILISSAMDQQFKLVNDGFAQPHDSQHKSSLPSWAVWKDQAFAIAAEPVVIAYNRTLMSPADVPGSHEQLADLLRREPDRYRGKITSYDLERSPNGYLYYTQDLLLSRDTLDFASAVGRTHPKFYMLATEALDRVASGEHLLAYNMVGSYMRERQLRDQRFGIVFPSDYTLVVSRTAFVTRSARHPAAAKLFLDYLLSATGQQLMAERHMQPIRADVVTTDPTPSSDALRPIHFGPALLANLDEYRRQRVLREWHRALEG